MSEPFLAEVRIVGFNFAPRGWAFCDGQILPINQNQSLYSLLGTNFGGDGRTTFALPDLRGRTPVHTGDGFSLAQKGGEETVTLGIQQLPQHRHVLQATNDAPTTDGPAGNVLAKAAVNAYGPITTPIAVGTGSVANAGGGQSHNNMMPYTALNFCIALQGLFPSRN